VRLRAIKETALANVSTGPPVPQQELHAWRRDGLYWAKRAMPSEHRRPELLDLPAACWSSNRAQAAR
jgi:hypothetical protein